MGTPEKYGFKREYLKVGCIAHNCKDDWREFIWFDDVRLSRLLIHPLALLLTCLCAYSTTRPLTCTR